MTDRVLDRVKHVDLRSLNYRVASGPWYKPRSYSWKTGPILDQGREGACVGFGWAGELAARPVVVQGVTNTFARDLYHRAQKVDEWPGENYEGTSVLAGAKVCQSLHFLTEYRWCLDLDDLVTALGYHGPVVIGVDWYTGMFNTNSDGFIRPTGRVEGGHCTVLTRVRVEKKDDGTVDPVKTFVEGVNSWGYDWGIGGHYRISLIDMAILFNGGDFCVPTGRKQPFPLHRS